MISHPVNERDRFLRPRFLTPPRSDPSDDAAAGLRVVLHRGEGYALEQV